MNSKTFIKSSTDAIQYIFYIFPILTITFGTIGNLWSFVIFTDKRFKATSMGFYNSYFAIICIIIQYIGALRYFLQAVTINPQNSSLFWCKLIAYTIRPLFEIASWTQVIITIDRYLFARYPNSYKFMRKRVFQISIIICISICFFLYHLPVAITFGYYDTNITYLNNKTIKIICFTQYVAVSILNDIGLVVLFNLIPSTLIIYFTIRLSILIKKSKQKVKLFTGYYKNKQPRFLFATVIQNIVFFVMTLPNCLIWPVLSLQSHNMLNESEEIGALISLLKAITNVLIYSYFASPFLINYCSNKLFRKIALQFKCRLVSKTPNKIS